MKKQQPPKIRLCRRRATINIHQGREAFSPLTLPVVEAEVHAVVHHHQRPLRVALGVVALLPVAHQRHHVLLEEVLHVRHGRGLLQGWIWRLRVKITGWFVFRFSRLNLGL